MASHFVLSDDPTWRDQGLVESMHFEMSSPMGMYFDTVGKVIDCAELTAIDPYADSVWSPDEAAAMADQLQRVYDEVRALWPWGELGDWEPPDEIGSRAGVSAFLFWLRRLFVEAAARRKYVIAIGD